MTRIGLVIFSTVMLGLILSISIFTIFYGAVSIVILKVAIFTINAIVLGFIIFLMIDRKQFKTYIIVTLIVYVFVISKLISSISFSEYLKENVNVSGNFIVKNYDVYDNKYIYKLKVENLENKKILFNKSINVTTYGSKDIEIGDEINAEIVISGYDSSYAFRNGSVASGYLKNYEKVGRKFVFRKFTKASQMRLEAIIKNIFGDDYGDTVSTFLIGSDLENSKNKNVLIVTGIYHIMAISGLHIGILSMVLLFIANYFFFRKTALKLTIALLLLYGLITGLSLSTSRAILMITITLIASILCIKDDKLNTVGCAGVIILMINPLAIYNIGFIYSFSIVFGLIVTTPTVKFIIKTLFRLNHQKEYILIDYFATIIVAQLYFIPISLYFYGNIYIYAIIVNALIMFLVPFLFVCSLLSLIFSFTFINCIFVFIVKFLIDYIYLVANYFETLPKAEIYVGKPSLVMVFIVYIVLFCLSYYGTKNIYEVNNGYFRKVRKYDEFDE